QRSSEPVIRAMLRHAMRILGRQFVMGPTIETALQRAEAPQRDEALRHGEGKEVQANGFRHSYDMLGEAALTAADAERYQAAYLHAIAAIGGKAQGGPRQAPGISIKLSALHPRFEPANAERVLRELTPRLLQLAEAARDADIGLTIDAEESERLELSLALLRRLCLEPTLRQWQGLGLAVQAYQKRAFDLIAWLEELAQESGRCLMVRLVKGAYWDSEIKRAQERGLQDYPVFTRKPATDVSYLACARRLLARSDCFYAQFATHNAHTVACVLAFAQEAGLAPQQFEFQRLHGMGVPLHDALVAASGSASRIYAPVGSYEELLPYLVRRLLENGANSSFVNRIADDQTPIAEIAADPRRQLSAAPYHPHPRIPTPRGLYPERASARGLDLDDWPTLARLTHGIATTLAQEHSAEPLVAFTAAAQPAVPIHSPADTRQSVGLVHNARATDCAAAVTSALAAFPAWNATAVEARAQCLERAAGLLEERMTSFMALCQAEAGKTLSDALSEVREAVDFCRYYAARAREDFAVRPLPGPTGEDNQLLRSGRGVFVCISPWNFPLAIFLGQITAALAAGNSVIAKPAEQTPLIATAAVRLLHEAGIPHEVLQLLPGSGIEIGATLVGDARIGGVAFTGGIDTAWAINRALAARQAPIVPFIAETGGLNAMLVDSSALPQQVVGDVLGSAFQSAGQRCSALRLLLVQDDIADTLLEFLAGAMAELQVGDPADPSTDVGPVIDAEALARLEAHAARMEREARLIQRCALHHGTLHHDTLHRGTLHHSIPPAQAAHGTYFAPVAFELSSLDQLSEEVFGPILHVFRYRSTDLDTVLERLNAYGYGLTCGIQSRIDSHVDHIVHRLRAGNFYVNRNMIGAVVGTHPFGGMNLSGTGPKAGGPDYLRRFSVEMTVSRNTTAAGGNTTLMSLGGD
ncbi:MAG TPA: bifunctional proline dehydrogenase/L-glutamate gamma-semialdehyde dehydrogenase PutA, partial [Hyphomicrobiales bacterium]|nr:bifunctional proline dehydrogenase/L-glutamate gamma-semialdehyde dehydrogenase PutA [Hyphomicrobiales bacterium]